MSVRPLVGQAFPRVMVPLTLEDAGVSAGQISTLDITGASAPTVTEASGEGTLDFP